MKKFFALLLAAVMLLSCTVAMAAETVSEGSDTVQNTTHEEWDTTNVADGEKIDADIDAYDSVNYKDNEDYDTTAELGTELWLQVTADGQIDVTVPLVLVFQTNIDGGLARTGNRYQILNNNNAEVVVTKIEFEKTPEKNDNPMSMVEYAEPELVENEYKAQLELVNKELLLNRKLVNGEKEDAPNLKDGTTQNTGKYDMYAAMYEKDAKEGGLFKLAKTANGGNTPTATAINVTMATGRLTFVTLTKREKGAEGIEEEVIDETKGVQLMTVTYTVAIDTSVQYGDVINGADGSTSLKPAGTTAQTAVEVTGDGSGTIDANAKDGYVVPQNLKTQNDAEDDE